MNLSPFEEFDLSPELLKALEKKGYTRPIRSDSGCNGRA